MSYLEALRNQSRVLMKLRTRLRLARQLFLRLGNAIRDLSFGAKPCQTVSVAHGPCQIRPAPGIRKAS